MRARETAEAVTYTDGVSPLLSASPGTFDFGSHLPNYIGGTTQDGVNAGSLLDAVRVYFFDATGSTDNPATATPFNLLVWQFGSAKDSVRLYTDQDHYEGGAITDPLLRKMSWNTAFGDAMAPRGRAKHKANGPCSPM